MPIAGIAVMQRWLNCLTCPELASPGTDMTGANGRIACCHGDVSAGLSERVLRRETLAAGGSGGRSPLFHPTLFREKYLCSWSGLPTGAHREELVPHHPSLSAEGNGHCVPLVSG
jgi:hypothetical protein